MTDKPYKVVILDDERIIGQVLRDELIKSGFQAYYIYLKTEGYDWILENKPDLIISDIKSPGMDGFQFLQWIKANPITKKIPFIFFTGFADLKNAIYAKKLGASDFISKPGDLIDILAIVNRVIEQDWHPDIYPNKNNKTNLEFQEWDHLVKLFKLVIKSSSRRMVELEESDTWEIYFIFEWNATLCGGLFTKPLEYNALTYQELYQFRSWLDEKGIAIGLILGFYQIDEYIGHFAQLLNIAVLTKEKTEDILKEAQSIHNTGKKNLWFKEVDFTKLTTDTKNQELFYKLIHEFQDLNNKKYSNSGTNITIHLHIHGISFVSSDQKSREWIDNSALLRIFTLLLVNGRAQKDDFKLDEKEAECAFYLFSMMPSIKTDGKTISIKSIHSGNRGI